MMCTKLLRYVWLPLAWRGVAHSAADENPERGSRAGGIEEVVVTARKREESDVLTSITAVTGDMLESKGVL